jgi:hypothetical protein
LREGRHINIAVRGLCSCVLLLTSLSLAPLAAAQGTASSLKPKLAGHWQLVSVTVDLATGRKARHGKPAKALLRGCLHPERLGERGDLVALFCNAL